MGERINCTVAFVLSQNRKQVLLLLKQKPIQHTGLYNGVGGVIKVGEKPIVAMARECREETGLVIEGEKWTMFKKNQTFSGGDLFIYTARCPLDQTVTKGDAGKALWFDASSLPCNIVPDVPDLIARARKIYGGAHW